ncbi:McrB family protein [Demequina muriae]|uniref:AAA family ATPase n=1 Tax=Demequina muriae TaxID=3051664 RepID=A0ABT8GE64_9MICO|nr:AAA family ATPase [Demequina sp. EGI L300058]MDN4479718.1 AAA family ATPase [Demequina sp. EGI L300058]
MSDTPVELTPADLAAELGVSPREVRRFLRREFARPEETHDTPWQVTADEARAVRERFAPLGAERSQDLGDDARWREFAEIARDVLEAGRVDIDRYEREYKGVVRDRMRAARDAVSEGRDGWVAELAAALDSGENLVFHITRARFRDLLTEHPSSTRAQLLELWESEGSPKGVAAFSAFVREARQDLGPGDAVALASNLLLAVADVAPFRARPVARALRLVGAEPAPAANVAARWSQFIGMLTRADIALEAAGIEPDDRIHTQSIVWTLIEYDAADIADGPLADRVRQWRGETQGHVRGNRINAVVEDAAWSILEAGLRMDASPLTGGASVWTAEAAIEVATRISQQPPGDQAPGFYEQLKLQFDGASVEAVQLLAELQFVRQLATSNVGLAGAHKALAVCNGIAATEWVLPDALETAFSEEGVFGGGAYFNQSQWRHLIFAARMVAEWRALEVPERAKLLSDPWEWLDFLEGVEGPTAADSHMRMVLCYVAWPSYFHPIVSSDHIKRIRKAFARFLGGQRGSRNVDIQRDLFAIDRGLQSETGTEYLSFYDSPFREQWLEGESESGKGDGPKVGVSFADVAHRVAEDLHMTPAQLGRIARVLESRRQVVFYGPPGTGKTYAARKLALAIAGSEDAVRLVQFHPSYSYEDFFEGFRPRGGEHDGGFSLQRGPLRLLAASAADNPDQPHFLIIDEMNRGNLAKVFGELYFLLEYRGETASLLYSPKTQFSLPDNLHIIGTMNTTDRSIGLVDAAIRRRFAFMEFHPDTAPVSGVLDRYLAASDGDPRLATLLGRLNALIEERDLRIGPSYFMRDDARTAEGLRDIWDFDILPLLFEHYYGHRSPAAIREEFSLDLLLGTSGGQEA